MPLIYSYFFVKIYVVILSILFVTIKWGLLSTPNLAILEEFVFFYYYFSAFDFVIDCRGLQFTTVSFFWKLV